MVVVVAGLLVRRSRRPASPVPGGTAAVEAGVACRMPRSEPDAVGDDQSDGGRWQRFTGAISDFALKPAVAMESATGNDEPAQEGPTTVAELEAAIKRADDKERLIGLLAAPVAAAIVFLVMSALVHNDPSALLSNGLPNPRHVNPNIYTELGLVTLALALIMLAGAWFRKRLVIGIAVRTLRAVVLQSSLLGLRSALHHDRLLVPGPRLPSLPEAQAGQAGGGTALGPGRGPRQPNKRYTPPSAPPGRGPRPKPAKGTEAG